MYEAHGTVWSCVMVVVLRVRETGCRGREEVEVERGRRLIWAGDGKKATRSS